MTMPFFETYTPDDLLDRARGYSGGDRIANLPFDIGGYLIAVTGQGYNHAFESALSSVLTRAGEVKGRSGSVTGDPLAGHAQYIRPTGEVYYARPWAGRTDVETVLLARENGMPILAYGPPGTGKTAMFEAAFPDMLTILGTGDTTVMDFVGQFVQGEDGKFSWVDGPLIRAAEEGRPLLIDEIGLIDTKELAVLYSLMDGRGELVVTANLARGVVKAKPGFYVIAATNPNAPGVRLSEALLSRFSVHVEVRSNWDLARDMGVPDFVVRLAQNMDGSGTTDWAPQFRELLAFKKQAEIFGEDWALSNLIASAPEHERGVVADLIKKIYGAIHRPARIG